MLRKKKKRFMFFTVWLFFSISFLSACAKKNFSPVKSQNENSKEILQPQTQRVKEESLDFKIQQFNHLPNPKIDIIFIVDNSSSMRPMQKKLSKKLNSFLTHLKNMDWRIGILTTDMGKEKKGMGGKYKEGQGRFFNFSNGKKFIDHQTFNYNKLFLNSIQMVGKGGSNIRDREYPITSLLTAMQKREGENSGFFRPESYIVTVILANEDESSGAPHSGSDPSELLTFFKENMSNQHKGLRVYGIIIIPKDKRCFKKQNRLLNYGRYGYKVADLVQQTGGKNISICETNYASGLRKISKDSYYFIKPTFPLDETPVKKDTTQVLLMPERTPLRFSLEGRQLRILSELSLDVPSEIEIHYFFQKDSESL